MLLVNIWTRTWRRKGMYMDEKKDSKLSGSVFHGLLMGVLALTVYFLFNAAARSTVLFIAVAAVILTIAGGLIFWFAGKANKKALSVVVIICVFIIDLMVIFTVTVRQMSGKMLFYPYQDEEGYAYLSQTPGMEELSITTEDGNIGGWFYHHASDNAPLLIYFPGNGECSASWMHKNHETDDFAKYSGYNIASVDYPGYGNSDGTCSDGAIRATALAAYDALAKRPEVEPGRIVVMGYSLGTGPANYVAGNRDVSGMILQAPYQNGYDLFNSQVPIFYGPLRLLVTYEMPSNEFARKAQVIPLILATQDDEVVPYESSLALSKCYPMGCRLISLSGFGHNGFGGNARAAQEIEKYLAEVRLQ